MRKLAVLFITAVIVLLVGCGPTSLDLAPYQEHKDHSYTISVTRGETSPIIEFSGHYMAITSSGQSSSRSVDGYTPREYTVKGVIVSCTFQKMCENGLLRVEILKGGEVVNSSFTSAHYGIVSVTAP